MSRRLWGLLGGVVLVAIAALLWTARNQTNVPPPVARPNSSRSRAGSAGAACSCAGRAGTRARASALASTAPPAAQEAAAPPAPPQPRRPLPLRRPMQDSKPPRRLLPRRPLETPSAPPVAAPSPARRSAPAAARAGREAAEVQGVYAPKSLAQLVGTWAYSTEDCERLFQRRSDGWAYRQPVDKFAQAAIVESTKKILLPLAATCRIEGASEAEVALKVSADCEELD